MTTVNERLHTPQAVTINGVDAGGVMQVSIQTGSDDVLKSSPDSIGLSLRDKHKQFVRGSFATQDWTEIINLLTGVVGTKVFYQKKSGGDDVTGYIKHTLTNPVIHEVSLRLATTEKTQYAVATAKFECKAADETKTIADMWTILDDQAKPTYLPAARGGFRVISTTHGTGGGLLSILHVLGFDLTIRLPLMKRCNDADLAYTTVEVREDGMTCEGSIRFEDASVATGTLLCQKLTVANAGALVLTVRQGQGAANKVLTINGVDFDAVGTDPSSQEAYNNFLAVLSVANNTAAPLSLTGANKIITIA